MSQAQNPIPINMQITPEHINRTIQCLIDNGIDEDEAEIVLQAIGYTLLDVELFPDEI